MKLINTFTGQNKSHIYENVHKIYIHKYENIILSLYHIIIYNLYECPFHIK